MKITNFGRQEHRLLSVAIEKALKDIGDEFGVDLKTNGGQIGTGCGRVNVEVTVRETAAGVNGAAAEWNQFCHSVGLPRDLYGKTFISGGTLYRITGLALNRPKFPVSAERVHDKRSFKFTAQSIKPHFPVMKAAA